MREKKLGRGMRVMKKERRILESSSADLGQREIGFKKD